MYIGIDIGGTKIAGGLVTAGGAVLARAACPTPAAEGGARVLGAAIALARSLLPAEGVTGVGVGTGGVVDARRGVIVYASDLLPGWAGADVKGGFERALGVPTAVDNDVNALAVGEGRFGPARGLGTVVFLALGTGVGGALLLGGRLHRGARWGGGEFGGVLLSMDPDARPSPAGRGALEAYASGAGLTQTWRELSGDTSPDVTGHDVAAQAALDPGGPAAEAVARTGVFLGFGLVSLANALDPDLIVIGGGLAALGESLLGPARRVLQARARPGPAACPVVSAFLGPDAALVGAAALAMGRYNRNTTVGDRRPEVTLTLDLPPDVQEAITKAAQEQGKTPEQEALEGLRRLYLRPGLPRPEPAQSGVDPTLALFARWAEEDATDDPEELARRNRDWEETKASLAANRMRLRDMSHLVDDEEAQ